MEALAPHSVVLTMKVKWLGGECGITTGQRSLLSFSGLAMLISGINCGVNKWKKKKKPNNYSKLSERQMVHL